MQVITAAIRGQKASVESEDADGIPNFYRNGEKLRKAAVKPSDGKRQRHLTPPPAAVPSHNKTPPTTKPKAVKGLFQRVLGSFSHKCQPMTVKEPDRSSIQTIQPKTADYANDIEEKPKAEPRCHWRCWRIVRYAKFSSLIGWILLGVATRSKASRQILQYRHKASRRHLEYGSSGACAVIASQSVPKLPEMDRFI